VIFGIAALRKQMLTSDEDTPNSFHQCHLMAQMASPCDFHQHRYLSFGCGAPGCKDVAHSVIARANFEIWPKGIIDT